MSRHSILVSSCVTRTLETLLAKREIYRPKNSGKALNRARCDFEFAVRILRWLGILALNTDCRQSVKNLVDIMMDHPNHT